LDFESEKLEAARNVHDNYVTVTQEQQYVTGYNSTVDLPFSSIALSCEPLWPNLDAAACFIVPIVSKTHIILFWGATFYENVGWTERRPTGNAEVATDEALLKRQDNIAAVIEAIKNSFLTFIGEPINAKWSEKSTTETPSPIPEH
jgi:hypothetical protein